jgi:RNA-binding protein 26
VAEQGHAKGTNLPTVGSVEVSWYAPGNSGPATSAQSAPEVGGVVTSGESAVVEKGTLDHEETVASGWGDNGEDDIGML